MNRYYRDPLYQSLFGHGAVLLFFLINGWLASPRLIQIPGGGIPTEPVIKARLINKQNSQATIAELQRQREQQKQQALQQARREKLQQEQQAQQKLAAEKLQRELAQAKQQAEQKRQQQIMAKQQAEHARLQAVAAQKKLALEKAQKAKQLALAKQQTEQKLAQEKVAKARQLAQQQAKVAAEQAKKASEAAAATAHAEALAAQQYAARMSWLDSELSRYAGEIKQRIEQYRNVSSAFSAELQCDIQIKLLPDGSVHEVRIVRSSGNIAYDTMSENAVRKAAPFDMPTDPDLMAQLRVITLGFGFENEG